MVQPEQLLKLLFRQSADEGTQCGIGDDSLVIAGAKRFLQSLSPDTFEHVAVCALQARVNAKLSLLECEVVVASLRKAK